MRLFAILAAAVAMLYLLLPPPTATIWFIRIGVIFVLAWVLRAAFREIFGVYQVRYPDGQLSCFMSYRQARNYARIFGGAVERARAGK